ncbi:MAG: hypothetical protein KatS3mg109_2089 [Pirellulaceae bacterium]|nr:MAG: hypothetical protein KatS3mg109_2089 [Pirellulaceae bacterium]
MIRWLSEYWQGAVARLQAPAGGPVTGKPASDPVAPVEAGETCAFPLAQVRPAWLLAPLRVNHFSSEEREAAWRVIRRTMAYIDVGKVVVRGRDWQADPDSSSQQAVCTEVHVEPFWMDRYLVSNRQFAEFVRDGGYRHPEFWPQQVRDMVYEFIDQSGRPGPRFWEDGTFPAELADHPVVGVSWFEACAYAAWAGKRLPTDVEWLAASRGPASPGAPASGSRPTATAEAWQQLADASAYPWGDLFDPQRANLWETGIGTTVPVDQFPGGDSPAGVRQLVGNVWEWTASAFAQYDHGADFEWAPLWVSLRGGAYDTYFPMQASRWFQSADWPLARRRNVGFRCVWSAPDGGLRNSTDRSPT